jgi:hypothetical protein
LKETNVGWTDHYENSPFAILTQENIFLFTPV